jgi:hypothetical protein
MFYVYTVYTRPVSTGSVQQIMPHYLQLTVQQQSRNLNGRTLDRRVLTDTTEVNNSTLLYGNTSRRKEVAKQRTVDYSGNETTVLKII